MMRPRRTARRAKKWGLAAGEIAGEPRDRDRETDSMDREGWRVQGLPFGRHKGVPLADVPAGYLTWLLGNKLSPSLYDAVAGEVRRRGLEPPPRPAPAPPPPCHRCGAGSGLSYRW